MTSGVRLALGAAAVALAAAPLLFVPSTAAAQQAPPSAVGIPDDVVAKAKESLGIITVNADTSIAWVAAPGVVVSSDRYASEVGSSATFTRLGSKEAVSCYVGVHVEAQRLSVLRCTKLSAPALKIESRYPSPGTAAFVAGLVGDKAIELEGGTVTSNDQSFMGTKRLQLSFQVDGDDRESADSVLEYDAAPGSPVIDAKGRVVSMVLISPISGGQPLGLTPSEITSAVEKALPLPESFTSAAIIAGGKRAIIPVGVCLVIGLAWGLLARNHTVVIKVLGMGTFGVVAMLAYSAFTLIVTGPQSLI